MLSSLLTITATLLLSGITTAVPHSPPPNTLPTYFKGRCQIGLYYCANEIDSVYSPEVSDHDLKDLRNVYICYRDGDISDGIEKPNHMIKAAYCNEGQVCQVARDGYAYRCAYGDNGRSD